VLLIAFIDHLHVGRTNKGIVSAQVKLTGWATINQLSSMASVPT